MFFQVHVVLYGFKAKICSSLKTAYILSVEINCTASGNGKLLQSNDKRFYLQESQDTKMCYKQSFAANSFLAGMKFAVHIYLLFFYIII